ncbi:isocitrate/isopropylmalate family dehydrogenase [Streptomyces sp. NPDC005303]|uniref:isocitrate/isopropylmalate family dehydrogenase n=1 Tax=Streptomyces sp. NPDC005303 TaxID=3155713 RepID=UPI0033ADFFD5
MTQTPADGRAEQAARIGETVAPAVQVQVQVAINIFRLGDGVHADPATLKSSGDASQYVSQGEAQHWCAALMLEHFGLPEQAARLNKAIEVTTAAGILTRDVGGTSTTEDVTKALIDALDA